MLTLAANNLVFPNHSSANRLTGLRLTPHWECAFLEHVNDANAREKISSGILGWDPPPNYLKKGENSREFLLFAELLVTYRDDYLHIYFT